MHRPLSAVLIEDCEIVAEALAIQLGLCDPLIRLETFHTLASGIRRLEAGGVDVAMVDLSLPDADGVQAVIAVREQFPDVPVVVVTGAGEEMAAQAIREGAQDYLTKPFESGAWLAKRLRYAVIRHEVRQQFCPLFAKLEAAKQAVQEMKEDVQSLPDSPESRKEGDS